MSYCEELVFYYWLYFGGMIYGTLRWDKQQYADPKMFERTIVHNQVSKMKTTRRIITVAIICIVAATIILLVLDAFFVKSVAEEEILRNGTAIATLIVAAYWFVEVFSAQYRKRVYKKKQIEMRAEKKARRAKKNS